MVINMRKKTELENLREYIIKDGIARISYSVSDIHDIIHPLSVKGYELLSSDFILFLEEYRVIIPPKAPIVLEITGKELNDDEKKLIDDTIWSSFCMNMTSADIDARACVKRAVTFLLYTIISVVLLFAVKNVSEEVITNLAYLPFWFFGYRLLIYLILDCMPLWKQRKWYRQLASMSVVFSDDINNDAKKTTTDEITKEISKYLDATDKKLNSNKMALQYIKDKGIVELGCNAENLENLIQSTHISERELVSPLLSEYLSQAEAFLSVDSRVSFDIEGRAFSNEEQVRIKQAIEDYYAFRIATEERGIQENRKKILLFAIFILLSAIIIVLWGKKIDVGMHEFIIMIFWFFGDYLLEFILISRAGYKKRKKIFENCRDMEVKFIEA